MLVLVLVVKVREAQSSGCSLIPLYLLPLLQQPDFAQSGPRLQKTIDDLFCSSLKLAVLGEPLEADSGMSLCFQEQMRGNW